MRLGTNARRWAAVVAATASLSAGSVAAQPALAQAATKKYLETNCVIKAVTGNGLKGHGCDLWGTPHWVEVGQKSHPLPEQVAEAVTDCLTHGMFGLVEYTADGGFEEMPPPYDLAGAGAFIADGCVKGITEATVKLDGKH